MFDLKQELGNFPAIDLKVLLDKKPDMADSLKNSIVLYNKALDSIKAGSEDIAIIELKKAVTMNPDFHEAVNLLGLCYGAVKDYVKASEMFETVMAQENNSIKAMNYLNMLPMYNSGALASEGKGSNKKRRAASKTGNQLSLLSSSPSKQITSWKMDALKIISGIILGILIMVIVGLFNAGEADNYVSASNTLEGTADASNSNNDDEESYEEKYKNLEAKLKVYETSLEAANQQNDYLVNTLKLFDAEKIASAGDPIKAADLLVLLKTVEFSGVEKDKFDKLYADIIPKAAKAALNQGIKLMNSKKYQEALDTLSKTQIYGSDIPNMDRILYNMGKCYMELEDSRNAVSTFQSIIDNYPKSSYAGYSKNYIKLLTKQP